MKKINYDLSIAKLLNPRLDRPGCCKYPPGLQHAMSSCFCTKCETCIFPLCRNNRISLAALELCVTNKSCIVWCCLSAKLHLDVWFTLDLPVIIIICRTVITTRSHFRCQCKHKNAFKIETPLNFWSPQSRVVLSVELQLQTYVDGVCWKDSHWLQNWLIRFLLIQILDFCH